MRFIDDNLLCRIENAKQKIDESKLALFLTEFFQNLEKQSIERDSIADYDNALRAEEVIANFKNAWEHAVQHQEGSFNRVLLTEVAALVEPCQRLEARNYADFRSTESFGWIKECYVPPAGKDRVMEHIDRMERVIAKQCLHPIEESAFTYLHISRIQPFDFGNKRTANIMTNSLLKFYGFAPIVFKREQRYRRLLLDAARGFKQDGAHTSEALVPYTNPGAEQLAFYKEIGEIELRELEAARDVLDGLKSYKVRMKSACPAAYYAVKRRIDGWFRGHNNCHQVRLTAKSGEIKVIGNIPYETLDDIMRKSNGLKRYKITPTRKL
jgi:hypothetical protein